MNQILQIPEIETEVPKPIQMSGITPQITFRLGYAEAEERQLIVRGRFFLNARAGVITLGTEVLALD